ncbi:MAG: pantoate--beta-alanine ligase [Ardenticatenaceae bacterium]|nr:pantoate--beta-alanine ligase [Ardenticatenaceae bacterium]
MVVTDNIDQIRQKRWQDPTVSWGLVPTMGALHDGHLALVKKARMENERVAASIFVNPTQFAAGEDLSTYPRPLERDLAMLDAAGVDLVFTPTADIMYPAGFQSKVEVTRLSRFLEGASRPAHFAGVTLIVCKLFNIFQPTRAYFGQKDAQQTVILNRMVQDLNLNLELVICPTQRASDGLALSSRNQYLSPAERAAATVLNQALQTAAKLIKEGETRGDTIRRTMGELISGEPLARIDYVSAADLNTLEELDTLKGDVLLSLAVFFGQTRLIDNVMMYDI